MEPHIFSSLFQRHAHSFVLIFGGRFNSNSSPRGRGGLFKPNRSMLDQPGQLLKQYRSRKMKGLDLKQKLCDADKKQITVAVEGNIGSGKSTLLRHFENFSHCEVIGEPLDKWTNVSGHNALGLLYDDPGRWSFSFNMYAQLTRVQMHMKPHNRPIKMLERSLYSTRYCFVQNDYNHKVINGFEFSVLTKWFDYLIQSDKTHVDLIVYLRADPEKCYERLRQRSRKEEAGVPLSFIRSLHDLHEDWLVEEKYPVPAPVLVLDANKNLEAMVETYDLKQQEILCGFR